MLWIIATGILFLILIIALIAIVFKVDKDNSDKGASIIIMTVFIVFLGIAFAGTLSDYLSPHQGKKPEICDINKGACMDTIYTHHDGKVYVSYKLRWKEDKVWEEEKE